MHCPHCSQALGPDAFFCGSCGQAVQAPPSFRPPAPAPAPVAPVYTPPVYAPAGAAVAAPSGGYGPYGASDADPYTHVSSSRADLRHRARGGLSPSGGRVFYLLALAVLLGIAGLYGIMSILAGHLAGVGSGNGSVCDSSSYGYSGSSCVNSVKLLMFVWVFWVCAVLGCAGGVGASSPRPASKIAGRVAQGAAIIAFLLGAYAIMSPAAIVTHHGSVWLMLTSVILGFAGAACSWILSEGDDIEVSQLSEWAIWATAGAIGLLTLSLVWDVHRAVYHDSSSGGFGDFLSGVGSAGATLAGILFVVAFFGFWISFVLVRLDRASE